MTLSADALKDFRQQHRGDLIGPDDARYEEARRVWNAMVDRRPAVIARPRGAADVIAVRAVRAETRLAGRDSRRRSQRRGALCL